MKKKTLQPSLFDDRDLAEIQSPDYPGERLVACRNPLLASERARTRQELLRATEKELDKIAAAVRRSHRPLRGKAEIGVRVGKVINRFKVGKHFKATIEDANFQYERKKEKIRLEESLDGIYIVRSSVPNPPLSSEELVKTYKGLSYSEYHHLYPCLPIVTRYLGKIWLNINFQCQSLSILTPHLKSKF